MFSETRKRLPWVEKLEVEVCDTHWPSWRYRAGRKLTTESPDVKEFVRRMERRTYVEEAKKGEVGSDVGALEREVNDERRTCGFGLASMCIVFFCFLRTKGLTWD